MRPGAEVPPHLSLTVLRESWSGNGCCRASARRFHFPFLNPRFPVPMRSFRSSLRSTLLFVAFAAAAGTLSAAKPAGHAADPDDAPAVRSAPKKPKDADGALQELKSGSSRFAAGMNRSCEFSEGEREQLATSGQHPFAAVLGDTDSRVPVEKVFDLEPGDLFTVRVAGSVATADAQGSLEYAVQELGVPLVVVLGNGDDATVKAAAKAGAAPAGNYGRLVEAIRPAVAGATTPADAVKKNVKAQVAALKSNAVLAAAVAAGKLRVVGGMYNLETGEVEFLAE